MVQRLFGWTWRLTLAAALAVGVGYLPLRVFGGGGIERAKRLDGQLAVLRERLSTLRTDNERMRSEAALLRDDLRTLERVARDELGWVRPGDIVFQFE